MSATCHTCGADVTIGRAAVVVLGVPLLPLVTHTSTEREAGPDGHLAIPASGDRDPEAFTC